MRGMIEVTGIPLEKLIRVAYDMSRPQGMGFLHFKEGELPEEDVQRILDLGKNSKYNTVMMDYIRGRSCKFYVYNDGERIFIKNRWYDHSDSQLGALLAAVGLSPELIMAARLDEEAYDNECLDAAIAFLKEHGGTFVEKRDDEVPNEISRGLYVGKERGVVKEDWKSEKITWAAV